MRKNIYNDKILMIKLWELNLLKDYEKQCSKEVSDALREYLSIDKIKKCIEESYSDKETDFSMDDEIGISLEKEINVKIKKEYEKIFENKLVSLKRIHNAYLWAGITDKDGIYVKILESILILRHPLTKKEFRDIYGNNLLEYVFLHGNYDYSSGVNPVLESDKNIRLIDNGDLKEIYVNSTLNQEVSLSTGSSQVLGKYLNDEMGYKIGFEQRQEKEEVIEVGKYYRTSKDLNGISFCYRFIKYNSLKIEVSSYLNDNISLNEKLEVLLDFYEILSKHYGEPSSYYVQRDNKKEALDLVWDFTKKIHINEIRSDIFFSDDNLEIVDNYVIGSEEGSFRKIVEEKLKERENNNLGISLYDNDMELEKKPIQP